MKLDVPVYKIEFEEIKPFLGIQNPLIEKHSFPTVMSEFDRDEIDGVFPSLNLNNYYPEVPLEHCFEKITTFSPGKILKVFKRIKFVLGKYTYFLSILTDNKFGISKKVVWVMKTYNKGLSIQVTHTFDPNSSSLEEVEELVQG